MTATKELLTWENKGRVWKEVEEGGGKVWELYDSRAHLSVFCKRQAFHKQTLHRVK